MDENIKEKIRKLLALSKSPNENEAAISLLKANKLMEEYQIKENDIEEICCVRAMSLKKDSWRDGLAGTVAWLYAVYIVKLSGRHLKQCERLKFYGPETDAYLASEMYKYLIKTIERIAKQNVRKNAKHVYRESYKSGLAENVINRIFSMGEKVSWAPERERKRTALAKRVQQMETGIQKSKIETPKVIPYAHEKGLSDGLQINLNRQTTGCGNRYLEA